MSTQTDSVRVAVPATAPVQPTAPPERMDRRAWDRIVSSAGAVLAVILPYSAEPRSTVATSVRTTSETDSRPRTSRSRRPMP